jgi:hypothetical protein
MAAQQRAVVAAAALLLLALRGGGAGDAPVPVSWPPYRPLPGAQGHFSSMGNHRFNLSLSAADAASSAGVVATVAWRRSDASPLSKAVYVTAAANSSVPIPCSFVGKPTADSATLSFAPVGGATEYFVYYLSFTTCEYEGGSCVYGAQVAYDKAGANGSCTSSSSSEDDADSPDRHATAAAQQQGLCECRSAATRLPAAAAAAFQASHFRLEARLIDAELSYSSDSRHAVPP